MQTRPGLDIFCHKTTGDIVILNYAVRPLYGAKVGWGPMVHVTADQMRERGLDLISENLAGFESRDGSDGSEFQKLPRHEKRRFESDHLLVSVRQEHSSRLILTPMHPAEGNNGFIGDRVEELEVNLPCSTEEFFRSLTLALQRVG
jgi:hypothetical protein